MLPQPQGELYRAGFNTNLCDAVPTGAQRVLDVGCGAGVLGAELKRRLDGRYVAGVEIDTAAARVAAEHLDDVFVIDVETTLPAIAEHSLDCIVFGDVLEHLRDPEAVLRRCGRLLADTGSVIISIPNVQHASVLKGLLRGDFMYQPEGLLDATHLRFFTHMSFMKLMCDAGFLPRIERRVASGVGPEFVERATPLLQHYGVSPEAAIDSFDTFQYIFSGTRLQLPEIPFADTSISFVVNCNDEDQLEANLRRSPCLDPGTPHELIVLRGQDSAADGFRKGAEIATGEILVFVHQDVYLPRGWDSQLIEQFKEAERRFGPLGVAGAFGFLVEDGDATPLGRVIDRQTLLDVPTPLPALATGLDEIVLAMRRDSPLQTDPALGFHLYGVDLALQAHELDLAVVVLNLPCLHNSLFHHLPPEFHESRVQLLEKWPDVRPLHASMGRLDGMEVRSVPPTWFDELTHRAEQFTVESARADALQASLAATEAELEDRRRHIENMEASIFWRVRRRVHRVLRRE